MPENVGDNVDVYCPDVFAVFVQCLQENVGIMVRMMSPVLSSVLFPPRHNLPVIILLEVCRLLGFGALYFVRNLLILGKHIAPIF